MTDQPNNPEDRVLETFFRRATLEGGELGPCPDPSVLAGLAEDRLLPEERQAVEEHVAICPKCLEVVGVLVRQARPPVARKPARVWFLLAAACVIAVLALGIVLVGKGSLPEETDTDAVLVAAAEDLARTRPDLFTGFRPLDREERLAARSPVQRGGGPVPLLPVNTVLKTRPVFTWEGIAPAEKVEVSLLRAGRGTLWKRAARGTELAYPDDVAALEAGVRYVWKISCSGVLGREEARRAFRVASLTDRRTFQEAVRIIDEEVPVETRLLLRAHLAIRRGFLAEAERAGWAHLRADPGDEVGRETLFHVLAAISSSEARRLREDP
jgi:hypothetical protein